MRANLLLIWIFPPSRHPPRIASTATRWLTLLLAAAARLPQPAPTEITTNEITVIVTVLKVRLKTHVKKALCLLTWLIEKCKCFFQNRCNGTPFYAAKLRFLCCEQMVPPTIYAEETRYDASADRVWSTHTSFCSQAYCKFALLEKPMQ